MSEQEKYTAAEVEHPRKLGPLKSAGVVLADVESSGYYTGGILGAILGVVSGVFVWATMVVLVLLGIKYSEVCHRYPNGGGIFSTTSHAFNRWIGIYGAWCISVSYILTMAISSQSSGQYLEYTFGNFKGWATVIAIAIVLIIAGLNLLGISESALLSTIVSAVAIGVFLLLIGIVVRNIGVVSFLQLFVLMFSHVGSLNPWTFLAGFGTAFLSFSGLESISQLSKDMPHPVAKVAKIGLSIVIVFVILTTPVLTMLATTQFPESVLKNDDLNGHLLSLLGEHFAGANFARAIGLNAVLILSFAVCTALIGFYRLLGSMVSKGFLHPILGKTNKRNAPYVAILTATVLTISVILLANGNLLLLGGMYAFGLLAAFVLTSGGIDVLRGRERKAARMSKSEEDFSARIVLLEKGDSLPFVRQQVLSLWFTLKYYLGILTTVIVLVGLASTIAFNFFASLFGIGFSLLGTLITFFLYIKSHPNYQVVIFRYAFTRRTVVEVISPDIRNGHNHRVPLEKYEVQMPSSTDKSLSPSSVQVPIELIDDQPYRSN